MHVAGGRRHRQLQALGAVMPWRVCVGLWHGHGRGSGHGYGNGYGYGHGDGRASTASNNNGK
jgi:hypothetical protein